jgi:hypothetical protein
LIVVGKQKKGENNRRIGIDLATGEDNIGAENPDKSVVSDINGDKKRNNRKKGENETRENERVVEDCQVLLCFRCQQALTW